MNVKNYTLIEKKELADIKSMGYLLEHNKTKARVVLIENDDENKVFTIGFRTPPQDSTGVAHIVEHTVLCGSKNFPVKDPFIELAKGSLNTFLNAMTYPDKTVYPVASCNDADFQNLMHVYLDAVFYPNIYSEEKIFKQEGWHYELDSVDGELKYNGVVFNEMKGVFSSPDQILQRNIQKSLFPDTSYGVESGGDPENIPDLTYEDYMDFHSRYYHPSNSYIYLYGDMDMEEKLNWIDENYLSDFDYLEIDSTIKTQEPFDSMHRLQGYYSVTEDTDDNKSKAHFSYNAVCGDSLDPNLYYAFQILTQVLVASVGAPLKQALLDAGLGEEIGCYFEECIKQPMFSVTAKNIDASKEKEFVDTIRKNLEKYVKEGLNKKSLLAAITMSEFTYRECDYGMYPKGLMFGLQLFDSWLYDDSKPFVHICANDTFAFLKEQVDKGYFEELIQKYLLDNTHTSFVCVLPEEGLSAKMDAKEAEKLADIKSKMTKEELEKIVVDTKELKKYQEEPDSKEALMCIPLLKREDLKKEARPLKNEKIKIDGMDMIFHNIYTNGINYFESYFDVTDLKEYLPYISFLSDLIGEVDTDEHEKLELNNEFMLHAGDYGAGMVLFENRQTEKTKIMLDVYSKNLVPETKKVFELLNEIIIKSHIDDKKRIKEILMQKRTSRKDSMVAAGHTTSARRAMGYLSDERKYDDQIGGIAYYDFLCDFADNFEDRIDGVIKVFKYLVNTIFTKERMMMDLTSTEDGLESVKENLSIFTKDFKDEKDGEKVEPYWTESGIEKNEGFATASKVQYVTRIGDFKKDGLEYTGTLEVVRTILSYDYLWNEIRVKNGAYGAMCSFASNGISKFSSYRDPKLAETNDVYEGIADYIEKFEADEREIVKYIIGTISSFDAPLTPRAEGKRSFSLYCLGRDFESVQKQKDEILSTNVESIRNTAKHIRSVLNQNYICTIGGEEKIEENKALFETTRTL